MESTKGKFIRFIDSHSDWEIGDVNKFLDLLDAFETETYERGYERGWSEGKDEGIAGEDI